MYKRRYIEYIVIILELCVWTRPSILSDIWDTQPTSAWGAGWRQDEGTFVPRTNIEKHFTPVNVCTYLLWTLTNSPGSWLQSSQSSNANTEITGLVLHNPHLQSPLREKILVFLSSSKWDWRWLAVIDAGVKLSDDPINNVGRRGLCAMLYLLHQIWDYN